MKKLTSLLFVLLISLFFRSLSAETTCPNKARYFIGGLLYNSAVDELSTLTMKPDLEQCIDSAVNTLYDFKVRFDKNSQNDTTGFFTKCLNGVCQIAKFSAKVALTVFLDNLGIQDSVETAFLLVDNTYEAVTKFWQEKAAPFFDLIAVFLKSLDFSQILESLTTCFGKTKVYLFLAKLGLRTLEYFTDSSLVKIGLTSLNVADKALTQYETLKNHKIAGPVLDILPLALPGGGISASVKVFKGSKNFRVTLT